MQSAKKVRGLPMLLLVASLGGGLSHAQSYPTKPVHIHTAGTGSTADTVARLVGRELSTALGQPVIVENRAGALISSGVAKAAPDGYTLMVVGGTLWTSPLFTPAQYDVIRDFSPVSALTRSTNLLVVHPSLPVYSVADLIKLAKAKPGELNYSSSQDGTISHLSGELFKSMADVNIVRIQYKDAQEFTDLAAGRIQATFGGSSATTPLVKSGKVRALATTGSTRSALFPDLPTMAETLPGFVSELLLGLFAPAKTPDSIVRQLNQAAVRGLEKPEVRDRLLPLGLEPAGGTPEQFAAAIKSEIERVEKVIKGSGIKSGRP